MSIPSLTRALWAATVVCRTHISRTQHTSATSGAPQLAESPTPVATTLLATPQRPVALPPFPPAGRDLAAGARVPQAVGCATEAAPVAIVRDDAHLALVACLGCRRRRRNAACAGAAAGGVGASRRLGWWSRLRWRRCDHCHRLGWRGGLGGNGRRGRWGGCWLAVEAALIPHCCHCHSDHPPAASGCRCCTCCLGFAGCARR